MNVGKAALTRTSPTEAQSKSGDLPSVPYSKKDHGGNSLNHFSDGCFQTTTARLICQFLQIPCRQYFGAVIAESGTVLY